MPGSPAGRIAAGFAQAATLAIILLSPVGNAGARQKKPDFSQITCECSCEVQRGNTVTVETKVLAAPSNDPGRCSGFNGVACRNPRPDGGTSLGTLKNCQGVVEHAGGGGGGTVPDVGTIAPEADVTPQPGGMPGRKMLPEGSPKPKSTAQ
ncbi:MAG TPA: hypothetical protein GX405_05550 [Rhizobiales bacterium]|nr:hypothetical protein [Hyphomicrobiales bacterium]